MFHGFVVIDKPRGMTSHDVIVQARRHLGMKKVGHSGTLDPAATGLMVLGVGRVTRLLGFITDLPKRYVADVVFGMETATQDAEGAVVGIYDMAGVELSDVKQAARKFVGEISQIPPMYSAVRVKGKRLHELARQGQEVERAPRQVEIHSIEVSASHLPGLVAKLDVRCGKGTYIRTLAADIGKALGGGAYLGSLRRLEVGSFQIHQAVQIDELSVRPAPILSPAQGLADYPSLVVEGSEVVDVQHGRCLPDREIAGISQLEQPFAVQDPAGNLLAVFIKRNGQLRPKVVLAAE